jgi:hypothetical protein
VVNGLAKRILLALEPSRRFAKESLQRCAVHHKHLVLRGLVQGLASRQGRLYFGGQPL